MKLNKMENGDKLQEIKTKFDSNEIIGFKSSTGKKYKLFISGSGTLCYYKNNSIRRGFQLTRTEVDEFASYLEVDKDAENKLTYKFIDKYRKLAELSLFTNDWINKCIALPNTYERWKKEGKKSLYDYGVTTGNKIDGKVITLEAIKKEYPNLVEQFTLSYMGDINFNSGRYPFRGYEMSLSVKAFEDGSVQGYLSMEYKGSGNGYYYLMINENTFIGYDVD